MTGRTLTDEDRAAAEVFARALAASARTHDDVAAAVGVTPGMVYQWAKPLRTISLKRAPAVAAAVGISDPARISVAYANWAHGRPSPAPPAGGEAIGQPLGADALRLAQFYEEASPAQREMFDTLAKSYRSTKAKR